MRPADRNPSFPWVFGILLAILACYPVTDSRRGGQRLDVWVP